MLRLRGIKKEYKVGNIVTHALKGVDVEFREQEFVSILGPSGCGKTTLLNIIGGLDRYDGGELFINDRSTKEFNDYDWDTYRNQSIGFVFQSYNLIMHQTVLNNVELALTLIGINKEERKKRAMSALESVGLGDQAYKRPNQLSGGQMQRVAIARAIINNPDILLADEPTGALDTESSVQIMEILKNLSSERLIIMVTHNPDLAEEYSTRIIKLTDGVITDDSNPYDTEFTPKPETVKEKNFFKRIKNGFNNVISRIKGRHEHEKKTRRTSMKYKSALKLSFNNLITKKMRTFLTSFAGSIGIIGIALILAISSGFNDFIRSTEENSLSRYPLELEKAALSLDAMTMLLTQLNGSSREEYPETDEVYVQKIMGNMLGSKLWTDIFSENDLASFKAYADEHFNNDWGDIKYHYNTTMNIFSNRFDNKYAQINPFIDAMKAMLGGDPLLQAVLPMIEQYLSSMAVWDELSGNQRLLDEQYELLGDKSHWPTKNNEIVLVLDPSNQISDMELFALGLLPADMNTVLAALSGDSAISNKVFSFEELLGAEYRLMTNADYYYTDADGNWRRYTMEQLVENPTFIEENSITLTVSGIVRPKPGVTAGLISGKMAYSRSLTEELVDRVNSHPAVAAQKATPKVNILDSSENNMGKTRYEAILAEMGVSDKSKPEKISLYPTSFQNKDKIIEFINDYNTHQNSTGGKGVRYTDRLAVMMSSINTITDAIKWVLVAFSSISLIVSSIMIGIITYISVLERTKEIGILRSIGARKKDISRVFNSETLMIGFASGVIGIIITILASIPINIVLKNYLGISGIASVVWWHAIILIGISVLLTLVSGFIPARMAAKKDPVTALRSD